MEEDTANNQPTTEETPAPRRSRPQPRKRKLYDAVCADCGVDCQVPVQPNDEKPVYCDDCFVKRGGKVKKAGNKDAGKRAVSNASDQSIVKLTHEISTLSNKLEELIDLLAAAELDVMMLTAESLDDEEESNDQKEEEAAEKETKAKSKPKTATAKKAKTTTKSKSKTTAKTTKTTRKTATKKATPKK